MLVSIPVKTYVLALVLYTAESYRSVLNVLLNIGDVARRGACSTIFLTLTLLDYEWYKF